MKILFFMVALANVVLFMWEFKHGAFERGAKVSQQLGQEQILLVSELKAKLAVSHEPVIDVDFISLYPPADNLLIEPIVLEDFSATAPCVALGNCSMHCSTSSIRGVVPPAFMQSTGELLFSAEPQNETIIPPN